MKNLKNGTAEQTTLFDLGILHKRKIYIYTPNAEQWWMGDEQNAILCCQQEVELNRFSIAFDPRLWKPLGWKMLRPVRCFRRCWTLVSNWLYLSVYTWSWKSTSEWMLWNQQFSLQSEILAEMISEKLFLNGISSLRPPPPTPTPLHDHWQTTTKITVDWSRV